jgi:hypothetical protein
VELKILVPYGLYRGKNGLGDLRETIEAENQGVVIPPFSMRWMRAWRFNEELWQRGKLSRGRASVVFKVPNKTAGLGLLKEIWVAGNRFQAELYVVSKADSLCAICSRWGHSEFRCHSMPPACGICSGGHRTMDHKCEVATCGRQGGACPHTELKCVNCGGGHLVQDGRCRAKVATIGISRGRTPGQSQPRAQTEVVPTAADWTETEAEIAETGANTGQEEDTDMTSSGTAPPMTS